MDYAPIIARIFDHLEDDKVEKAVMGCLRLARHIKDYSSSAIFLRELNPNKHEVAYSAEAGHLFRFHSGQHSDLKPASRCSPGSLF